MKFRNYTNYTRIEDVKRLKFIQKNIDKINNKKLKVLDIGCGNGNISNQLGELGHLVLGIDISEEAINVAKKKNKLINVEFKAISAEELTVNEKFDVIVCSEVIEHLNNPELIIQALKKLLSEKGVLIITVPNGFGPRELIMTKPMQWAMRKNNLLWRIVVMMKKIMGYKGTTVQSDAADLTHVQFFSKKSLIKMISREKLNLKKFEVSNFLEGVFPFSFITKKIVLLQKFDCWVADILPHTFASGFMTTWTQSKE